MNESNSSVFTELDDDGLDIEAIFGPKAGKHGEERLAAEDNAEAAETPAENTASDE